MSDVFDKEKRSDIMRQVKSKMNKSTELRLIENSNKTGLRTGNEITPLKGTRILRP